MICYDFAMSCYDFDGLCTHMIHKMCIGKNNNYRSPRHPQGVLGWTGCVVAWGKPGYVCICVYIYILYIYIYYIYISLPRIRLSGDLGIQRHIIAQETALAMTRNAARWISWVPTTICCVCFVCR